MPNVDAEAQHLIGQTRQQGNSGIDLGLIAAGHAQPCARNSECLGDPEIDAARAAEDEDSFAGEIEPRHERLPTAASGARPLPVRMR